MKIKNIIENFKIICEETGIHPSEECLFDNAVKIYISNKIGESKRENIKSMNESKDITKATDKQVTYLINLGYKGEINNLTKEEARQLINSLKEEKWKKKSVQYVKNN